ncbi:MAG: sulfite exporter TauE/SafE family protein [Actinomycetota bacterium]
MAPRPAFVAAGVVIGSLTGLFGVGGSSVATPLLSLLGVPPLVAVASPLPATLPSAAIAAVPYIRAKETRPRAAAWTLLGAVPAAILGALASEVVGGRLLLVASGLILVAIGQRVIPPIAAGCIPASAASGRLAHWIGGPQARRAFGWFLSVTGVAFVVFGLVSW